MADAIAAPAAAVVPPAASTEATEAKVEAPAVDTAKAEAEAKASAAKAARESRAVDERASIVRRDAASQKREADLNIREQALKSAESKLAEAGKGTISAAELKASLAKPGGFAQFIEDNDIDPAVAAKELMEIAGDPAVRKLRAETRKQLAEDRAEREALKKQLADRDAADMTAKQAAAHQAVRAHVAGLVEKNSEKFAHIKHAGSDAIEQVVKQAQIEWKKLGGEVHHEPKAFERAMESVQARWASYYDEVASFQEGFRKTAPAKPATPGTAEAKKQDTAAAVAATATESKPTASEPAPTTTPGFRAPKKRGTVNPRAEHKALLEAAGLAGKWDKPKKDEGLDKH